MRPRPRRPFRRRLASYLLVLTGAALMLRLTSCVESRVLYFPSRDTFRTPAGYEDVSIRSPDGLTLHGWVMPARGVDGGARPPAVLHLHGNAGNVESHASWSESLPEHGISVLLLDYRGYGRSAPAGSLTRG